MEPVTYSYIKGLPKPVATRDLYFQKIFGAFKKITQLNKMFLTEV